MDYERNDKLVGEPLYADSDFGAVGLIKGLLAIVILGAALAVIFH